MADGQKLVPGIPNTVFRLEFRRRVIQLTSLFVVVGYLFATK